MKIMKHAGWEFVFTPMLFLHCFWSYDWTKMLRMLKHTCNMSKNHSFILLAFTILSTTLSDFTSLHSRYCSILGQLGDHLNPFFCFSLISQTIFCFIWCFPILTKKNHLPGHHIYPILPHRMLSQHHWVLAHTLSHEDSFIFHLLHLHDSRKISVRSVSGTLASSLNAFPT